MSLKKNLLANYLGQGWTALMSIVFVPVYINYLGMEAYGLIGVFAMLLAFLALVDQGLTPTLNREMSRFKAGAHTSESIHNLLRSLEIICVVIVLLLAVVSWSLSGWVAKNWLQANNLPIDTVGQAIAIMGLVAGMNLLEGLYRGAILGLQRQVWLNVVVSIFATLRGVGAVLILMLVSPTIEAFFLWQGLMSFLTVLIFAAGVHSWLPKPPTQPRFSREALAGIWRFAAGMIVSTTLALLLTQVDKILLSRLFSLELFGVYALATMVANALYQLVIPVTQTYYPLFTELVTQNKEDELAAAYHQGAQLVSVFVGSAALCLMFFGESILFIWTGDFILTQKVLPIMRLLALGTLFNSLLYVPYMLQLAYGWPAFAAKINFVAVIILVPTILVIVPKYGAVGAAWVWVLLNAGYIAIAIHYMHRRLLPSHKWDWYVKDNVFPLLTSTVSFVFFYLFRPAGNIYLEFVYIVLSAIVALSFAALSSSSLRGMILKFRYGFGSKFNT